MGDVVASVAKLSEFQIHKFFSKNAPLTQQLCDTEAERIIRAPVHPTFVQGGSSYTVISNDNVYVVQFRSATSALDMDLLTCIEQAYGGFTPHHESVGVFGALNVYKMRNVGGVSMYLAREPLLDNDAFLLRRTVSDFARFFASAWHKTPERMHLPDRNAMYREYLSGLQSLRQGLPERFAPTLDKLITKLPGIFSSSWPLVPHHTDLLENNIHVNPQTGEITGICDWKDTIIGPFGLSLGGLETMLGVSTWKEGWVYHHNQQELRDLFWATFWEVMRDISEDQKELIEVARLVGLFMENGFTWIDDHTTVPATDNDRLDGLCYLEAVTLKLWEPL